MGQGKDREIVGSASWWGGRLVRNLKIAFQDRGETQEQHRLARHDVLQALKAAYLPPCRGTGRPRSAVTTGMA